MPKHLILADGKYELVVDAQGCMTCLRHGEPWRDLCGDNLIGALVAEIEIMSEQIIAMSEEPDFVGTDTECGAQQIADFLNYDFEKSAAAAAEEVGCYVKTPEEHQLFLDIDTEEQFFEFNNRYKELFPTSKDLDGSTFKTTVSKSGLPHRHIVVSMFDNVGEKYKVTESQRIMLQFSLGSDRVREYLSVMRWVQYVENPTRLFEPKPKKE